MGCGEQVFKCEVIYPQVGLTFRPGGNKNPVGFSVHLCLSVPLVVVYLLDRF